MPDFCGANIMITGAASGIGAATASLHEAIDLENTADGWRVISFSPSLQSIDYGDDG